MGKRKWEMIYPVVCILELVGYTSNLTMKDALVEFCGCLQMRKVFSSTMKMRTETSTRLHASIRDTASKA